MKKLALLLLGPALISSFVLADDQPIIEHYGLLPFTRSISLSPDGEKIAYIQRGDKGDYFIVSSISDQKALAAADASEIKARSVFFLTNDHVLLRGTRTQDFYWHRKQEQATDYIYNLRTKKMMLLLDMAKAMMRAPGGQGSIIGIDVERERVYVSAWVGKQRSTRYLITVDLNSGDVERISPGTPDTVDWFVDRAGNVLAREDYDQRDKQHRVYALKDDKWRLIYLESNASIPDFALAAVSDDANALIFTKTHGNNRAAFRLSLEDGSIEGPVNGDTDKDIRRVFTEDLHRTFGGFVYDGLVPEYELNDVKLASDMASVSSTFPSSSVWLVSSTQDRSKAIYQVSGNESADQYFMHTPASNKISLVGSSYPEIDRDQIGEIQAIRYDARDGLSIEAIVHWPVEVETRENLPLLVFPHGGPASYDSMRFDWWAQYFARLGYVVLQPNFRGSTGSGKAFTDAGNGNWGTAMQNDVSDGVLKLISTGHVDPDRVCIMGASYGGYAALAGGAFSPELYRCVVSVAGVSDIPYMLDDASKRYWAVRYWNSVIGDHRSEHRKLLAISPVNSPENFRAPVLLIHGVDDVVVPLGHSTRMKKALKRVRKDARLIKLSGEDHWLSNSETRLAMLEHITEFLNEHNPVEIEKNKEPDLS